MTNPPLKPVALLIGSERPFAADIEARLNVDGYHVLSVAGLDAIGVETALAEIEIAIAVLIAPMQVSGVGFLDMTDEAFVGRVDDLLDIAVVLQKVLAHLRESGALVVVTSRGYLGAWGGADEMAFSGATVALTRSISLENTPRDIRANVVALDFQPEDFGGDRRQTPDHGARIAGSVAFLVGPDAAAVKGEVILANAGRSLQRREARDRRHELN
jgi:NAD(P)-dependent dehydrogenase (short-subunit alcohol dehydrogenase family)